MQGPTGLEAQEALTALHDEVRCIRSSTVFARHNSPASSTGPGSNGQRGLLSPHGSGLQDTIEQLQMQLARLQVINFQGVR